MKILSPANLKIEEKIRASEKLKPKNYTRLIYLAKLETLK